MQNIDHDSLQISMFSNGISELKLVYPQPTFLSYHSSQVQFTLPVFKQMLLVIFWVICMLIFNNKIKKCSKRRAFPTPLSTGPPGLSPDITMVNGFFWYVQRDWLPTKEDSVRNISTLITLYWILIFVNQQIILKFRMYVPMCASVCICVWMYILRFYEFIW